MNFSDAVHPFDAGRSSDAGHSRTGFQVDSSQWPGAGLFRAIHQVMVGIVLCGSASLLPVSASADGIAPGEWKLTESVIMNGNKAPPNVRSRCLSPEQAADTAKTFSPEYRTVNSGCERTEFNSTATSLKWRMQCTGQLNMDVSGDFIFDTPQHYTATIMSKGSMAGRQVVDTSVSIEGELVGDCR
jgi:hypothetical protein